MTVTLKSVRARLSRLEGLNARGIGTAVEQQQFELACLRELLAMLESQSLTAQQPDPAYLTALGINISDAECEEIKAALRNQKTAAPQPFHTIMSPAPTVPEIVPESLRDEIIDLCAGYEIGDQGAQEIWEACRATVLNGGKS
ncbi:hypothetical protein [Enterobacter asburiae]|uniref:hypothetical protein n=1 Tax=Enterobacter asburiae TaxID=61645 RepID=UPI003F54B575